MHTFKDHEKIIPSVVNPGIGNIGKDQIITLDKLSQICIQFPM